MKPLSADAPAFIPSRAVVEDFAFTVYRGLVGGAATRTFDLRPMAAPRTQSLQSNVLSWIGKRVVGSDHVYEEGEIDDDDCEHGCHDNDYRLQSIVCPLIRRTTPPLGAFPNNIQHYYWIHDGLNEECPWYMLAQLTNGTYVYLVASCNFSGFACLGNIYVYAAKDMQTLYDEAMTESARFTFACCFDKATREKLAADRAARKAALQAPVRVLTPAEYAASTGVYSYEARMAQAQKALQARRALEAAPKPETPQAAAFKILDERLARWQTMTDSDHELEVEQMEASRDRMRDKYPGGRHGW